MFVDIELSPLQHFRSSCKHFYVHFVLKSRR